jgi:hypothetical protein
MLHLVKVQRRGAFSAGGPAHCLTRPRWDVELRVNSGGRNLGDLLNRGGKYPIRYEKYVAAEASAFVPRGDISDDPGRRDRAAAGYVANRYNDIIKLEVSALLDCDVPQEGGRIQQALYSADTIC